MKFAVAFLAFVPPVALGAEPLVEISTDFPGGNGKVERIDGATVHLSPDLRGDRPWFYWCVEVTPKQPGRVTFVTPEKVINFKNGAIGNQGPAVSTDRGKTWRWMGTGNVNENTFRYDFAKAGQPVRFAVTIPYVESDLSSFLKRHADNANLETSVLTKSRGGREVELLRVGEPGPERKAVMITARHHAAETIASYVFEGFIAAAMADTPAGKKFRERHVLFAVPFVDKDGVEAGDQGKNRKPHDHNRDYGEESIYPEIRAIKRLHEKQRFRYALDFHCPTLVMPDHQVMYFVGAKQHPKFNFENVSLFAERIKNGLPEGAPNGPLVWLRDEDDFSPKSSRYFGFQDGVIMSATLEIPFAPPGRKTDPESCRRYGRVMLEAFVNSKFAEAGED